MSDSTIQSEITTFRNATDFSGPELMDRHKVFFGLMSPYFKIHFSTKSDTKSLKLNQYRYK